MRYIDVIYIYRCYTFANIKIPIPKISVLNNIDAPPSLSKGFYSSLASDRDPWENQGASYRSRLWKTS